MYSQASPTANSIDFTLLLYHAPCLPHGTGLKEYLIIITIAQIMLKIKQKLSMFHLTKLLKSYNCGYWSHSGF